MKIDYDNLTTDQLEELIEFVEWEKVPYSIISEKILNSFYTFFPSLIIKIEFEKILEDCIVKTKNEKEFVFFKENEFILSICNRIVTCSYKNIYEKIFIKNKPKYYSTFLLEILINRYKIFFLKELFFELSHNYIKIIEEEYYSIEECADWKKLISKHENQL